jgi:hypothetical protein
MLACLAPLSPLAPRLRLVTTGAPQKEKIVRVGRVLRGHGRGNHTWWRKPYRQTGSPGSSIEPGSWSLWLRFRPENQSDQVLGTRSSLVRPPGRNHDYDGRFFGRLPSWGTRHSHRASFSQVGEVLAGVCRTYLALVWRVVNNNCVFHGFGTVRAKSPSVHSMFTTELLLQRQVDCSVVRVCACVRPPSLGRRGAAVRAH